jgi:hypothetical protein
MNNSNLKNLFSVFKEIKLTQNEKNSIRLQVSQHMHRRPIGSRSSFLTFRYASIVAFALVLFVSSGGLIAFASQGALPGKSLYNVKRATEELKKATLGSPTEKASYELALIDKRFSETNELISKQSLTTKNEAIIIEAIKQHTDDFKQETNQLAINDPAEALSYNAKLTNTLKTGTHILLALSHQQNQVLAKADSVSPNTLVLAAYASAEKITAEKKQLESMVVSDTNIATVRTAEKKYSETIALLAKQNIQPVDITAKTTAVIETPTVEESPIVPVATFAKMAAPVSEKITEEPVIILSEAEISTNNLQKLVNELRDAYNAKKYAQVVIISEEIQQQLSDEKKIQEAEDAYNVTIPAIDQKSENEVIIPTTTIINETISETNVATTTNTPQNKLQ